MSALSPSGPDQPSVDEAYKTTGNTATKQPIELHEAQSKRDSVQGGSIVSDRLPNDQPRNPTTKAPGGGIHGAPPGEEARGYTEMDINQNVDAEQMAPPGEGDVYEAVEGGGRGGQRGELGKPGASGAQPGLESDLDRKKAEQAGDREMIKEQRSRNIDVGGILGQSEAPADPTEEKMRA